MSIFSWLMGKKSERRATAGEGTHQSGHRKSERLERRELVYEVVRDAMLRAGVLAASYKFKVLSLDARGMNHINLACMGSGGIGLRAVCKTVVRVMTMGRMK